MCLLCRWSDTGVGAMLGGCGSCTSASWTVQAVHTWAALNRARQTSRKSAAVFCGIIRACLRVYRPSSNQRSTTAAGLLHYTSSRSARAGIRWTRFSYEVAFHAIMKAEQGEASLPLQRRMFPSPRPILMPRDERMFCIGDETSKRYIAM